MNKLRSKKYLYWQIPSPMFTPVERNRLIKLLFEAYKTKNFDKLNEIFNEGIYQISYPCYKKRTNKKYFSRVVHNFSKDKKRLTLYKYIYPKRYSYKWDKFDEMMKKKINKRSKNILLRGMAMFEE